MPGKSGRAARGFLIALAVVLAGVVAGPATDAGAVGGINTVAVNPGHGRVAALFQATYSVSPCANAVGLTIGFSWNGLPPGGPTLGSAVTDAACHATITARPPATTAPGNYVVYGFVQLPTGSATPQTEATAAYTVDVTPAATASATATSRATATARASTTATASAGASSSVNSPALTPDAADQPQPSAIGETTVGSTSGSASNESQSWWTTLGGILAIIGGLVLAALLAVMFLFLLLPVMRRRSGSVSTSRKDRAA